jgi:hypothetical protein
MNRVIIYVNHFTTKWFCASLEDDLVNESRFIFFCLDANLYNKCLRRITLLIDSIRLDALKKHHSLELQSKDRHPPMMRLIFLSHCNKNIKPNRRKES